MKPALSTLFLAFLTVAGFSATITVPDDFPTIQGAIQAASAGDTILVRPGKYVENINLLGKEVVLKSEKGPSLTTIDGRNPADPNKASTVTFDHGEGPTTVLEGFTITNGSGTLIAGDLYGGGVICNNHSSPVIRGNVIRGNWGVFLGGGIQCNRSSPLITGNLIRNNTAEFGGGIQCRSGADAIIVNNIVILNKGRKGGGGIRVSFSSYPFITNNTVVRNLKGGGIFCTTCSPAVITNTIIRDNVGEELISARGFPAPPTVTFCNVGGGWPGLGNIDSDPLFADIDGYDFHLRWDSPCRDGGTVNIPDLPAEDNEGDPRVVAGSADMGADEFHSHLYRLGDVVPGGPAEIRVAGTPGLPVQVAIGLAGQAKNPVPTPHGSFFLAPPWFVFAAAPVPAEGIAAIQANVPPGVPIGAEYPLQALVGAWGDPQAVLTNLMVLTVE